LKERTPKIKKDATKQIKSVTLYSAFCLVGEGSDWTKVCNKLLFVGLWLEFIGLYLEFGLLTRI